MVVVMDLEIDKLSLQVADVPEKRVIQKRSPNSPDQCFDEGMRSRHIGNAFDLLDSPDAQVRFPSVIPE